MADFSEVLKTLEGLIPPEAVAALENAVKAKEQEFVTAAEAKFGVKPSVVSDVTNAVKDAAPDAVQAVQDALPKDAAQVVAELTSQLKALQAQVDSLKSQNAANQTTTVMGQGEPVPHTLFLEDGSVVQNHAGIATHYSTPDPSNPDNDVVKRVIAAYPTA